MVLILLMFTQLVYICNPTRHHTDVALFPVLLQLLKQNKHKENTHSVVLKYWAHRDNSSPAAIAEVIDGLSLPLHKPIIANLDTAL